MPQFFFDMRDGETFRRDTTGIELTRPGDIPREVFVLLSALVHDRMLVGRHVLTVQVRDESDDVLFVSTFTLDGHRFV